MALATLCSGIKQAPFKTIVSEIHPNHVATATAVLPGLSFQAFIVDHGVREGSSIEAIAVSRVLEQYGTSSFSTISKGKANMDRHTCSSVKD
jgi:hypothetical protein